MTGENGNSASGHGFTVDESSIYWTQQAHEDQRPQFKNDHQKPADGISGRPPTMNSLQPPPPMPPPSSRPPVIYRTDDQLHDDGRRQDEEDADDDHNGNRVDAGDGDERFESTTRQKEKTAKLDVSGSAAVAESHDFPDYDDGFKDLTTPDRRYRQPSSANYDHNRGGGDDEDDDDNNWKAKQHRWTSEKRQQDDQDDDDPLAAGHDDGDNGYQVLACPATNNFYTHFRW